MSNIAVERAALQSGFASSAPLTRALFNYQLEFCIEI